MHQPSTFCWLDEQADRFAKALLADDARVGERIGIWAPNMREWVAAAVGAQRIGGAIVPLNARLGGGEAADILRRAGVVRLVSIGDHRGASTSLLRGEDMPDLRRVIVLQAEQPSSDPREIGWNDYLALGGSTSDTALRQSEAAVTGDTISDILFTSGTTGTPKGAMFLHRSTVLSGHGMMNFARVTDADCLCPLGPFSHFAGYKAGWVNALVTGATVCWLDTHDGTSLLDAIQSMRVTVMPAPPVVWQDLLDYPARADWDLSSLRFAATGSTTIPPPLVRRLIAELNLEQVGTGYGFTESGA